MHFYKSKEGIEKIKWSELERHYIFHPKMSGLFNTGRKYFDIICSFNGMI